MTAPREGEVSGGAVEVVPPSVVPAGGPRVGVAEGALDVLQGDAAGEASVAKAWPKVCGLVRSAEATPVARARRRSWECTLP